MAIKKMSLTRVLAEIKLLDKRIEKKITQAVFVDYFKERNKSAGGVNMRLSEDDFKKEAIGQYKSIETLMQNRKNLKTALAAANAITTVTVGNVQYSIACAIEVKRSIVLKKLLLQKMKKQFYDIKAVADNGEVTLEHQIRHHISTMSGVSQNNQDENKELIENMVSVLIEKNRINLMDPLDIRKKIDALDKEIDEFESQIDVVLSEINGKTEVEIDFTVH